MIRRTAALASLTIAALVAGSGCSTFTKNDVAARANGHELSVDELERITADLGNTEISQFTPNSIGEIPGGTIRSVLNEWINSRLALDALQGVGITVDQAARDAGRTDAIAQLGQQSFDALGSETQEFFVEDFAVLRLVNDKAYVAADVAQAAYEAGLAQSKTLCMRFIAAESEDAAADLYQQLQDGADFATLAASPEGGASADGGIYKDASGSECVDASTVNATLQQVGDTPVGQPSEPIVLTGSDGSQKSYIILQRPWSEVADQALPLVRRAIGPDFRDAIYTGSHVRVDSRYGSWDPATESVVPVT